MGQVIYTNENGTPIERPEPPPAGCPIEDTIAYIRAYHAWADAVQGVANQAFDTQLRKALK